METIYITGEREQFIFKQVLYFDTCVRNFKACFLPAKESSLYYLRGKLRKISTINYSLSKEIRSFHYNQTG